MLWEVKKQKAQHARQQEYYLQRLPWIFLDPTGIAGTSFESTPSISGLETVQTIVDHCGWILWSHNSNFYLRLCLWLGRVTRKFEQILRTWMLPNTHLASEALEASSMKRPKQMSIASQIHQNSRGGVAVIELRPIPTQKFKGRKPLPLLSSCYTL